MNRYFIIIIPILFLLLYIGCSKNDPSINATRLRISLTDAPLVTKNDAIIISELNVDIQKIEVSMVDSTSNSENWVELDYKSGAHDVLKLTNGKSKQIVDQYFPSGILKRIRITFGNNTTIRSNDKEIDMILDPSMTDGVVSVVNASLYAHYITNIMIDINAALSIYEENGNYFFKPNIRVFSEAEGGALRGYVLPPEANSRIVIANETDTLLTFPEFKDGMFMFKGLEAGKWDIFVFPSPNSGYRDSIFSDTIFSGKITDIKSKIVLKKIGEDDDIVEGE